MGCVETDPPLPPPAYITPHSSASGPCGRRTSTPSCRYCVCTNAYASSTHQQSSPPTRPHTTINQVYYRLPPPDKSLEGEYLAEQLEAGPEVIDVVSRLAFHFPWVPGMWVGKGFFGGEGWAYNLFMEEGKLVRK